jgi:PAS domain S-box-containing protein
MSKSKQRFESAIPSEISSILEVSQLNLWTWDISNDYMRWSKGLFQLYGLPYSEDNMLETFIDSVIEKEKVAFATDKNQVVKSNMETFRFNLPVKNIHNETIWIEVRGELIKKNGQVAGFFGTCNDITSFKLNEAEIKAIQKEAKVGFWHLYGDELYWSRAIREIAGLSRSSKTPSLKEWINDYIHEDDRARFISELNHIKQKTEITFRQSSKSQPPIIVRVWVMPSPFETGKLIGSFQDVTTEMEVQKELEAQSAQFDEILQTMIVGVVEVNMDGIITFANDAAHSYLEDTEMIGRYHISAKINQFATDGSKIPAHQMPLSRTLKNGEIVKSFKHGLLISGKLKWFTVNSAPIIKDRTQIGAIVNFIETTEEIEAQNRLEESEKRFRTLMEEAPVAIQIFDKNGILLETNAKWEEIWKESRKKVEGSYSLFKDKRLQDPTILAQIDNAFNGARGEFTMTYEGKNLLVSLDTRYFPIFSSNGQVENLVVFIDDVSERIEADRLLRESEEFQHETIDALSIGLIVIQSNGFIEQTNKIWDQMVTPDRHLKKAKEGANLLAVIKPMRLGARLQVGLSSVINGHSPLFEMELQLESGRWFSLRASMLQVKFQSMVITMQDITVRKRVEQALEDSLGKYRSIYNMTPVMMHSIDANGILVSVSNFWLEKMGYQRHEVIGKHLSDFLTEESKRDAEIVLPIFFEKGSIYDVSYHFVTQQGDVIETILSSIQEGKGTQNARSLSVVTDITALKKAERQLKQNREDLLEAQSLARIGNFELDFRNQSFMSSTVFDEILEIGNAKQKSFELFKQVVPDGDYLPLITLFKKVFDNKKPLEYVGAFKTLKTKQTVWLQCLGRVVLENGKAMKMVGTIQDVTKNKTAEIEIQKLSDRLKLAMEGANIGVWEGDLVAKKLHWEATMYDLFDVVPPVQKDTLMALAERVHPEDQHVIEKIKADLENGLELVDYDFRINNANGIRHLRSITRQIKDNTGKAYRMVGVVIDTSKDRELLRRLEQSLSEKDILIKEVHHRVKNNMQMISSILALKALDLTDESSKSIFDDCTVRIKSMAVVHDQLYRFYNVSEIDISEYLHHLLSGLNALMGGQSGNYVIEIEADEFKMDVDIALLCGLIVSELVANAFKHGFKGHDEGKIQVIFKNDGQKRTLLVTNTGNVMPDDVLEIKTTSLGMSLIRTFTTQLSGQVSKHSHNGLLIEF